MDTFQIAELARRTGFSRPTLRYYERIGLLEQPERSQAGYRVYDADDEARLQFIRRAKRLGLTLEEIRDLVGVWADGECTTTGGNCASSSSARSPPRGSRSRTPPRSSGSWRR